MDNCRYDWGCAVVAGCMVLAGCFVFGGNTFLADRDKDIQESTQAIARAHDDIQRAKAYSARGAAYSEKARFSRITKLIAKDEYERLFDLAMKDHDQAVALDPKSSEVYFNRAQANYDRGSLDLLEHMDGKAWFDAAAADFELATAKDPHSALAFDRLGLTYEANNEPDKAIRAYTRELAFDSFAKQRLADAYCNIGFRHQQEKQFAAAAMAYEKSTEFGHADDKSCPYEPFQSLVAIYTTETRQYDKAWETVGRALKQGRWIAPELMERLRRESGRRN